MKMEEILEILEKNFRYTDEQIAVMAGKTVEEVREAIQDYEEKSISYGIICSMCNGTAGRMWIRK